MEFDLRQLDERALEELGASYDEQGYVVLDGVPADVLELLQAIVARRAGLSGGEAEGFFAPDGHSGNLALETRRLLARVPTDPALAARLLQLVGPVLARVMGPLVQVSREFHCQVKGAPEVEVDYGGFEEQYWAVQGTYLPHQDFTGATLPTSPCFAVLWIGVNDCPDWTMRFWPGSHRKGLVCDRWFPRDHPLLDTFPGAFDAASQPGKAVLFSSLLLHGGTNPSARRRVSCDIRFFPLCGFLDSPVHALAPRPLAQLEQRLESERCETLRAAVLENLIWLGRDPELEEPAPLSILNWAAYLRHRLRGDETAALAAFRRLVNEEVGIASTEVYLRKYHGRPASRVPLASACEAIATAEPQRPDLAELRRWADAVGATA